MSLGDFASMFSKMKETFSQAFNLKSINKEIKLISEQFQSIIKLDKDSCYNYIEQIDSYQQKSDPGIRKIGICFDIKDISYKDGIYTINFVYCISRYNNYEYEEDVVFSNSIGITCFSGRYELGINTENRLFIFA